MIDKAMRKKWICLAAAVFLTVTGAVYMTGKAVEYGLVWRMVLCLLSILLALGCLIAALVSIFSLGAKPDNDAVAGIRPGACGIAAVLGILAAVLAPNQADREHDFIVNGIRMSEGAEDFSGRIMILAAVALICYFLVMGAGRLILRIRSLDRKNGTAAGLFAAGLVLTIVLGVFAGRFLGQIPSSRTSAVLDEETFLSSPGAVKKGDLVEFGSYPQNGSSSEPIQWRVLEKKDGIITLLSEYALDRCGYGAKTFDQVTYAESRVRSFLLGTFLDRAFSPEEKRMLLPVSIGNGEADQVSLLTYSQGKKWLGKITTCLPVPNLQKTDILLSPLGDCSFFLRPDKADDTKICYYITTKYDTKHLLLDTFAYETSERGVRPVIRVSVGAGK